MSKRKIPRLALVTLSLGAACGGDGDGDGQGNKDALDTLRGGSQDVGQERVDAVVAALCDQFNECDPTSFREDYTTVQQCVASVKGYFEEAGEDDACKDALLDYYSCYTKLSCEQSEDDNGECSTLGERVDELCDLDDDYTSSDDTDDYDYDDYDY